MSTLSSLTYSEREKLARAVINKSLAEQMRGAEAKDVLILEDGSRVIVAHTIKNSLIGAYVAGKYVHYKHADNGYAFQRVTARIACVIPHYLASYGVLNCRRIQTKNRAPCYNCLCGKYWKCTKTSSLCLPPKPTKPKAAVKSVSGWFFSCTHMGGGSSRVVYCGGSRRKAREWAKRLRDCGESTGPMVRVTVPAPPKTRHTP